jgi:hypothetical protein
MTTPLARFSKEPTIAVGLLHDVDSLSLNLSGEYRIGHLPLSGTSPFGLGERSRSGRDIKTVE